MSEVNDGLWMGLVEPKVLGFQEKITKRPKFMMKPVGVLMEENNIIQEGRERSGD